MKKLTITLDEKTTNKYLKMMTKRTELDVFGDCMPSGGTVNIDIGEAEIDFVEN